MSQLLRRLRCTPAGSRLLDEEASPVELQARQLCELAERRSRDRPGQHVPAETQLQELR